MNKKTIFLHLLINVIYSVGTYLFTIPEVKITKPDLSCLVYATYFQTKIYKAMTNEILVFVGAILTYLVCLKYANASDSIAKSLNVKKVQVLKSKSRVKEESVALQSESDEEDDGEGLNVDKILQNSEVQMYLTQTSRPSEVKRDEMAQIIMHMFSDQPITSSESLFGDFAD